MLGAHPGKNLLRGTKSTRHSRAGSAGFQPARGDKVPLTTRSVAAWASPTNRLEAGAPNSRTSGAFCSPLVARCARKPGWPVTSEALAPPSSSHDRTVHLCPYGGTAITEPLPLPGTLPAKARSAILLGSGPLSGLRLPKICVRLFWNDADLLYFQKLRSGQRNGNGMFRGRMAARGRYVGFFLPYAAWAPCPGPGNGASDFAVARSEPVCGRHEVAWGEVCRTPGTRPPPPPKFQSPERSRHMSDRQDGTQGSECWSLMFGVT